MVYTNQVTVSTVLAGTIGSFNQTAYTSNMAALIPGVTSDDITLAVAAGSVRVEATITTASTEQADSVLKTVKAYNATFLSTALGVVVEQYEEPVKTVLLVVALPPPSSAPAPASPGLGVAVGIVLAAGIVIAHACVCLLVARYIRRCNQYHREHERALDAMPTKSTFEEPNSGRLSESITRGDWSSRTATPNASPNCTRLPTRAASDQDVAFLKATSAVLHDEPRMARRAPPPGSGARATCVREPMAPEREEKQETTGTEDSALNVTHDLLGQAAPSLPPPSMGGRAHGAPWKLDWALTPSRSSATKDSTPHGARAHGAPWKLDWAPIPSSPTKDRAPDRLSGPSPPVTPTAEMQSGRDLPAPNPTTTTCPSPGENGHVEPSRFDFEGAARKLLREWVSLEV